MLSPPFNTTGTQVYLQGSTVLSVAGANYTFDAPASSLQSAWNPSMRSACAETLQLECFSIDHIPQRPCFCLRLWNS